MSNSQDLQSKLEAIGALRPEEVQEPTMPVDVFLQEGENLVHWCQPDKDLLTKAGLDWALVDNLPVSLGALREAQSQWIAQRFTQEEASREWEQQAPEAFDLRNTMLHEFRFAYRSLDDLRGRVAAIADGAGNADLVQDLNDLATLGKANPAPLEAIGFDMTLLEQAATRSDELGSLLAVVNGERSTDNAIKDLRDRAFTLCKMDVAEINQTGQYVFWRNANRLKGYASAYNRKHNRKVSETPDEISA